MKRFLKQVLSITVSLFVSIFLFLSILVLLARPSQPRLGKDTVLRIKLDGKVVEASYQPWRNIFKQEHYGEIDLVALKETIKDAAQNKKIRGIYLEAGNLQAGWANLEEIRATLLSFQQAGKFIVAYGEHYTQKSYYLASVADHIVLNPSGVFLLQGLHQTVFFYKNLLDKLQVTPQVFRVGRYKSAVEPFFRQQMSESSKRQSSVLLQTIHQHFLHRIAADRKISPTALQRKMDRLSLTLPHQAYQAKLVSELGHTAQVETLLNDCMGAKKGASIRYIAHEEYRRLVKTPPSSANEIAVLVAEGNIVSEGSLDTISAKRLAADLKEVRENDRIKAVILRINSPGGSALASEVLWQELVLTKAQKPVVASLSDVAASGGYYLASACNCIVAHPTTITGSIGIFGMFFDVNRLLNKTFGISTDVVETSTSADIFSNPGRPMKPQEKAMVQRIIEEGYDKFLERVSMGRNLKKNEVARLAEGRVWSGAAAQKRGLIDHLGGIEKAIHLAATLAAIEKNYTVSYWSKKPTLTEQILDYLDHDVSQERVLASLQKQLPMLAPFQQLLQMQGIQARMPYSIDIN